MLQRPKKRIWPLLILSSCSNMWRQPAGERKGSRPSGTSNSASVSQKLLPSTVGYFFPEGTGLAPELRMALKKSDDGSSTITSLFLLKLAL